ncbi:hypothetical protein [Bosea sp. (in: a-proteobacteria)]|jgi:hypothetical protein|uniref:hypothetical protein n=1 Tax=Bosea sp. (in: a-proteobacteria) TaxID=1871050 RepID=UPI0035649FF7
MSGIDVVGTSKAHQEHQQQLANDDLDLGRASDSVLDPNSLINTTLGRIGLRQWAAAFNRRAVSTRFRCISTKFLAILTFLGPAWAEQNVRLTTHEIEKDVIGRGIRLVDEPHSLEWFMSNNILIYGAGSKSVGRYNITNDQICRHYDEIVEVCIILLRSPDGTLYVSAQHDGNKLNRALLVDR